MMDFKIVRPVTEDGMAGYDAQNQFVVKTRDPRDPERITVTYSRDPRDNTCVICEKGWETKTAAQIDDQWEWRLVDGLVHQSCMVRYLALNDRVLFYSSLVEARIRFGKMKRMDSQYWGVDPYWGKRYWWKVELLDHPLVFTLGKRKRVYSISLEPMPSSSIAWWKSAEELFADMTDTKHFSASEIVLHAYTDEQFRSYIERLSVVGDLKVKR